MKQYEKMAYGENLGWCKPLSFLGGKVVIAVNEGSIVGAEIDGHDAPINAAGIRAIAELVNPDAVCNGSDDTRIILDADCRELGCASCPWRDDCEAMEE